MATAQTADPLTLPQRDFSPVAGLLSYLVPGLGQIVQGRVGKGLLFFVCIYSLFFYGMYLGSGSVTIEVTGQGALLQTENANISTSIAPSTE